VVNIGLQDVSALGAAYLAGLESGVFDNLAHLTALRTKRFVYTPDVQNTKVSEWYKGWQKAVQQLIR
jgi:glycerol kinase